MIFIGSRYENEFPFDFVDPLTGQVKETVMSTRGVDDGGSYRYHLWSEVDRIDQIAADYIGNADSWWLVMDANPEVLSPLDIRPGDVIRVPYA